MPDEALESGAPSLLKILERIENASDRQRVARLLLAARAAIAALRELDVTPYEPNGAANDAASLSVWNDIAADVAATVDAVHGLLKTSAELFPPGSQTDAPDFDLDFEPLPSAPSPECASAPDRGIDAAITAIHAISAGLQADAAELGRRLKVPSVAANTWNLVAEVQAFRGKMRMGVGELVFGVCSAWASVKRADVIPEYREDQCNAAAVRRWIVALKDDVVAMHSLASASVEGDAPAIVEKASQTLRGFMKNKIFHVMRSQDCPAFFELEQQLGTLLHEGVSLRKAQEAVEGFLRFLESLLAINRRQALVEFDQEAASAIMERLSVAELDVAVDIDAASSAWAEALRRARELLGREPDLDAFLRQALLKPPSLEDGIAELRRRIAAINW